MALIDDIMDGRDGWTDPETCTPDCCGDHHKGWVALVAEVRRLREAVADLSAENERLRDAGGRR